MDQVPVLCVGVMRPDCEDTLTVHFGTVHVQVPVLYLYLSVVEKRIRAEQSLRDLRGSLYVVFYVRLAIPPASLLSPL
jgi:hypothetical protein